MKFNLKVKIKKSHIIFIILLTLSILFVWYNNLYLRPSHYKYDLLLRCLDHLLAAIFVPVIWVLMTGSSIKRIFLIYVVFSLGNELGDMIVHLRPFQLFQYSCDFLGAFLILLIYKIFRFESNLSLNPKTFNIKLLFGL